ncbi:MAG: hypothetical protein CBB99_00835 [Bacteroidetes bacterium TMED39]|nr:MAG: hypothetical protein CBB99_00835 [Bacteroidetes bacterium TMED39]
MTTEEENKNEIFEDDMTQASEENQVEEASKDDSEFEETYTPSGNVLLDFYNQNKNLVLAVLGTLILSIVGGWYYFYQIIPEKNKEAENALFHTEDYFVADSMNIVLNGDGINPGALDIIEDYGNTNAGNKARFMAGVAYLKIGQYEEAKDVLSKVSFDDEHLGPMSIVLLGDAYSELGEIKKAANLYWKAVNKSNNLMTAPYALSKAAIAYEKIENYKKAMEAYQRLLDDYSDSEFAQTAEVSLNSLKYKINQ